MGRWSKQHFVVWFTVFALLVANIFYTNLLQHQTEQKFCGVVHPVAEIYKNPPQQPTTELGRKLQTAYAQLDKDLHCD